MLSAEFPIRKPRICVPVTGPTGTEIRKRIATIPHDIDFIEVRFDSLEHPSRNVLRELAELRDSRIIFTCRSQDEGGSFRGYEAERLEFQRFALELGFSHVDVELRTLPALAPTVQAGTRLIVSYHDFTGTPPEPELHALIAQMARYKSAIIKIATMVQTADDVRRLYAILLEYTPRQDMIVIGMGKAGVQTRILGPYLGAYLTFAAAPEGGTAPGQIPYTILQRIYSEITNLTSLPKP